MAGIKGHPALLSLYASRLPDLKKRDGAYWAKCIFHPDKNPSLNIGRDDKGDWVFHCFGCGVGGDTIEFIEKADKITFKKAKDIVEKATGGNWEQAKQIADKTFQKLELDESKPMKRFTLEEYAKFELALYESEEAKAWLFTERGITYDTARRLHFGYAPHLKNINQKYSSDLEGIADKGWIITPAVDKTEVVAIEARSMAEKKFSRKIGMDSKVLYGVEFITWDEPVYVVEGKFDQAIMVQAGYNAVSLPNATANLTPEMRDLLMSAPIRVLAGDNDGKAGSDKMMKMWQEFQERTYRLVWPTGMKDANDTYIKYCSRDIDKFREVVDTITLRSYSNPMPGIKSIQEILRNDESDSAENREDRFKFSIKPVDKMAIILPGSVVYISAASTGTGKTQITLQETLSSSRKNGDIVLNYQTQLRGEEVGEIITANLLAKDRNLINRDDRHEAARRLKGVQYYVGHDPTISTADGVLDLIEAGVRRTGANIVVLDLFHDIFVSEKNEIQAQQRAMRRFKLMMQRYLCIGFVIGQPRKVDPKNVGKPLDIYDSKGSEAVVSEADTVFYLYREPIKNMTDETQDRLSPEVQVRCMKARNKGKGAAFAKVFFLGKISTFREIAPIEEPVPIKSQFDF